MLATEKDVLFQLARRKAGGVGVEIGSALGASSCFIARGLRPNGGRLYCVDTWNVEYREEAGASVNYRYREDGTLLTYRWDNAIQGAVFREIGKADKECPTYAAFQENTRCFSDVISSIRKDSVEAAAEFSLPLDFLFIDGWHEYKAVRNDCLAWLPKLKSGGIVVLHDSGWADGVKRVIAEDVKPWITNYASLPNMFWGWVR